MSDEIILDVLLSAIVLLAMPIGFWRGLAREVFVSAGILVGIATAAAWSEPWGRHASDWLNLGTSSGRFVAEVSVVLLATFIIGYGGAALGVHDVAVSLFGRLVGAAVAAANATALLAWALAAIGRDIADTRAVRVMNDAFVAGHLLRDDDRVLLAIAVGAASTVLVGFVVAVLGRGRELPQADAAGPIVRGAAAPDRLRPVRIARDTDEGKFEPASRQFDPRSGRYGADAASISTTVPLSHVDQSRWALDSRRSPELPVWGTRSHADDARQSGRQRGREWLRRSPPSPGASSNDGPSRVWSGQSSSGAENCSACGALMSATDAFCPRCGTTASR